MLLAEFESGEALVRAVKQLRSSGHADVEAYSPHALEGLDELEPRPRLPWIAGTAGFLGAGLAYFVQWYLAALDYPLNVGGRPAHAPLAFVPITFEMGILAAALSTFVLLLHGTGLPRLWRPIFEAVGFERVAVDGYFLETRDDAREALSGLGAKSIVTFALLGLLLAGCDFQRMAVGKRPLDMRAPPEGTVSRSVRLDERSPPVTLELLRRGRERFEIHCAACHGVLGDANSVVADRMLLRRPRSLLDPGVRRKEPGEIYEVISRGFGLMPSYAAQLPVKDRWAVAEYVKALQLSQAVPIERLDAPEKLR